MEMCFHSNQLSWGIKHPFINLYSKYHSPGFICLSTMLAPLSQAYMESTVDKNGLKKMTETRLKRSLGCLDERENGGGNVLFHFWPNRNWNIRHGKWYVDFFKQISSVTWYKQNLNCCCVGQRH